MYTEKFSFAFVARALIAAAERRRPGLATFGPEAEATLRETFRAELADIRRNFLEIFDDRAYVQRLEQTMMEICLPRYLAEAKKQSALEKRDFGLWRGGDLIARGTYAVCGFALGLFLVKAPFIPIPEDWTLLAFALLLGAPFLPDFQIGWYQRRYRKVLERIVGDLEEAEVQHQLFSPIEPVDSLAAEQTPGERVGPKGVE